MNDYTLLETVFTNDQLFLISAASTPEVDIDYETQTLSFNTTKTYDRDEISKFIGQSYAAIEEFKNSFNNADTLMTDAQKSNVTWITDQLRKLEQYLNT